MWRESMDQNQVPLLLKQATVPPYIRKTADQNLKTIGQYHIIPISLRSLKEYSVKKIVPFLEGNNLLNVNQHGFRSKGNCLSQLLENYDTI